MNSGIFEMKTMFEEAERQLGMTVGFADAEQRETFLATLADKVRYSIKAGIREAFHTIIPEFFADLASTSGAVIEERLLAMDASVKALEAELESGQTPDVIDDVLKEHRARQEDWR